MKRSTKGAIVGIGLVSFALAACGGQTTGAAADGGTGSADSSACVEIDLSTYDQSCVQSSDCVSITSGLVCAGECTCGGSTINASGQARYVAALGDIPPGDCFCPNEGVPQCIGGTCTLCLGGPNDPGHCSTLDEPDTGPTGECVFIDPSTYDRSCATAADCIDVTTGTYCDDSCDCGGTAISASEEGRYAAATSSITPQDCPCFEQGPTECIQGVCTICAFGGPPIPGCIDAGP